MIGQGRSARPTNQPPIAVALAKTLGVSCVSYVMGCGGGLPLLHPAQTLATGDVRALAGVSATVATGELADAIRSASIEASTGSGGPRSDPTFASGALVAASLAPGLAPVVGARVGIGWNAEGGLTYTGRSVRGDLRRSFGLSRAWAISVGAGGWAALYGRQDGGDLPDVDLRRLHGWGADVPLLIGYASDADLYRVWVGLRGGWEHVDISEVSSEPGGVAFGAPPVSLSATRYWGGALFGLAVGFRHVHVAMELDASYVGISGEYGRTHASAAGIGLVPASAFWWDF